MKNLLRITAGVILLVLTIIIIIRMLPNPDELKTESQISSLKTDIEQVCKTGSTIKMKMNLEQKTYSLKNLAPFLIKYSLKKYGNEPKYLLYYESFPPGEAIAWEMYLNLPDRVLLWDDNTQVNYMSISLNHILADGEKNGKMLANRRFGDIGKWENNFYYFNPSALFSDEKSAVKYRPCGENSLCLMTIKGINKIKLDGCNGLKRIVLKYNGCDDCSDFYLASPCQAELTINKVNCQCNDVLDINNENGETEHCIDRLDINGNTQQSSSNYCIEIEVDKKSGFCATKDTKIPFIPGSRLIERGASYSNNAILLHDSNSMRLNTNWVGEILKFVFESGWPYGGI